MEGNEIVVTAKRLDGGASGGWGAGGAIVFSFGGGGSGGGEGGGGGQELPEIVVTASRLPPDSGIVCEYTVSEVWFGVFASRFEQETLAAIDRYNAEGLSGPPYGIAAALRGIVEGALDATAASWYYRDHCFVEP